MGRLALAFGLVGALPLILVDVGCSTSSAGGAPCSVGGACSATQVCTGGIAGCMSNCQCLGGTWQAPCPADLPSTGSACTAAGAECGYTTGTNACGADNCYCQGGAWNCEPSCVIPAAIEDAGACPPIAAVSYNRACTVSSDCIGVGLGDSCDVCLIGCVNSAINKSAVAQYRSDVARSPANGADCGCPISLPGPCCIGGLCEVSSQCENASSAGDAPADAGATDAADGGYASPDGGPADARAE